MPPPKKSSRCLWQPTRRRVRYCVVACGIVGSFFLTICPTSAVTSSVDLFNGRKYEVFHASIPSDTVAIRYRDYDGQPFRTFIALRHSLGTDLLFATNGGMFEASGVPTGVLVENGHWYYDINLKNGTGNFYLKPNGVFYLTSRGAGIMDSAAFDHQYPKGSAAIIGATQSGPLLLVSGTLNGRFREDSPNRNPRSGVCVSSTSEVYFVISRDDVTFFELATFMARHLKCSDGLYLDGAISAIETPEKPNGSARRYGAFIVVEKASR